MPAVDLLPVIDQLLLLVSDSERFHGASVGRSPGQDNILNILAEFRLLVNGIRNRVVTASQRYVVAFVGAGNVGKSTLLNQLLGAELAPRRNGPCTACPVEFSYGDQHTVEVEYFQSLRKPTYKCSHADDVHSCLAQLADSDGAQSSESIRRISVAVPLDLLRSNSLVIADTPGFGAAQTNGAEGSHQEALKRYLERDVSQVLWVVLAEQGITRTEADFHRYVFGSICHDVLVTGSEDYDESDKSRFRKRFGPLFDAIPPAFHFVSGKTGMGVNDLAMRLASIHGRVSSAEEALLSVAHDLRAWAVKQRYHNPYQPLCFWNPAVWAQWKERFRGHELTRILSLD